MTPTGTLHDLRQPANSRPARTRTHARNTPRSGADRASAPRTAADRHAGSRGNTARSSAAQSSPATGFNRPTEFTHTVRPTRATRSGDNRILTPSRSGRLGSKQQVSVRGRRVIPIRTSNPWVKFIGFTVAVAVAGVIAIMFLSGVNTEQSFQIGEAREQQRTLSHELESLERDVQDAKSAGNLAKEAAKYGMVTPGQTGILATNGNTIEQRREAKNEGEKPIIDVGSNSRPRGATSDPNKTDNIPGLVPHDPIGAANSANHGAIPPHLAGADVPYAQD